MNARRASLLISFVSLVACGGAVADPGVDGGAPADPHVEDEYADMMAHAICDHAPSCCETNGRPFAAEDCLVDQRARAASKFADAIAAGATYDPAAARACASATAADVTACSDTWSSSTELFLACKGVFVGEGKKEIGEACNGLSDCDLAHDGVVQCATGPGGGGPRCVLQTPGKPGDPCSLDGDTINDCIFNHDQYFCPLGGVCAPLKNVGEACTHSQECIEGLRCSGGACAPGHAVGDACDPIEEVCDASARCDGTTKLCVPRLALGATCESDSDCPVHSQCDGHVCVTTRWAMAYEAVCVR